MASSLYPADIAFGAAMAFLVGIFTAGMGWPAAAVLAIVAALGAVATLAAAGRPHLRRAFTRFVAALAAGVWYYHIFFAIKAARTNLPLGRPLAFSAVIADEPQPSQRSLIGRPTHSSSVTSNNRGRWHEAQRIR